MQAQLLAHEDLPRPRQLRRHQPPCSWAALGQGRLRQLPLRLHLLRRQQASLAFRSAIPCWMTMMTTRQLHLQQLRCPHHVSYLFLLPRCRCSGQHRQQPELPLLRDPRLHRLHRRQLRLSQSQSRRVSLALARARRLLLLLAASVALKTLSWMRAMMTMLALATGCTVPSVLQLRHSVLRLHPQPHPHPHPPVPLPLRRQQGNLAFHSAIPCWLTMMTMHQLQLRRRQQRLLAQLQLQLPPHLLHLRSRLLRQQVRLRSGPRQHRHLLLLLLLLHTAAPRTLTMNTLSGALRTTRLSACWLSKRQRSRLRKARQTLLWLPHRPRYQLQLLRRRRRAVVAPQGHRSLPWHPRLIQALALALTPVALPATMMMTTMTMTRMMTILVAAVRRRSQMLARRMRIGVRISAAAAVGPHQPLLRESRHFARVWRKVQGQWSVRASRVAGLTPWA